MARSAVGSNNGLGSTTVTLGFASDDTSLLAAAAVNVGNAIQVATGPGGASTLGTTLTAGTATFSGAITLGNGLDLTAPAGGTLLLSGAIGGSGGLTKTGLGLLVLSTSNSFTGGTTVDAGTLELLSSSALPAGTRLIVGKGGTVIFNPAVAGESATNSAVAPAVPEPGTLVLLIAAAAALLVMYGRRRCKNPGTQPEAAKTVPSSLYGPDRTGPDILSATRTTSRIRTTFRTPRML